MTNWYAGAGSPESMATLGLARRQGPTGRRPALDTGGRLAI